MMKSGNLVHGMATPSKTIKILLKITIKPISLKKKVIKASTFAQKPFKPSGKEVDLEIWSSSLEIKQQI